jgi:hypothetical protein
LSDPDLQSSIRAYGALTEITSPRTIEALLSRVGRLEMTRGRKPAMGGIVARARNLLDEWETLAHTSEQIV